MGDNPAEHQRRHGHLVKSGSHVDPLADRAADEIRQSGTGNIRRAATSGFDSAGTVGTRHLEHATVGKWTGWP